MRVTVERRVIPHNWERTKTVAAWSERPTASYWTCPTATGALSFFALWLALIAYSIFT